MAASDDQKRLKARERARRYRQRKAQERARSAVVVDLKARSGRDGRDAGVTGERDAGSALAAVESELEGLPAARARPGLAAAARKMAALLDDPSAAPQGPAAAKQLVALLDALREPAATSGRLAQLRAARIDADARR